MVHEQPYETFGLGSEPFKQRVADIMSSPVETCPPQTPINNMARTLTQKKISAMVITDGNGKMFGLVSERDLISKVLAIDGNPSIVVAADIMQKNPPSLPANAFFYQALLTMLKSQSKYIVVTEKSRPIGMVILNCEK